MLRTICFHKDRLLPSICRPTKIMVINCSPDFLADQNGFPNIRTILYIDQDLRYSYDFIRRYRDCDWIIDETHKQWFGNYDHDYRFRPNVRRLLVSDLKHDICREMGWTNYYRFLSLIDT